MFFIPKLGLIVLLKVWGWDFIPVLGFLKKLLLSERSEGILILLLIFGGWFYPAHPKWEWFL